MNQKLFSGKVLLLAIALLGVCAGAKNVSAQMSEVLIVKQKAKTTIKPKAKPSARNIDFVRRVSIIRVEKKSRKNYQKPVVAVQRTTRSNAPKNVVKRQEFPLMALQLRLMLVNSDGKKFSATASINLP